MRILISRCLLTLTAAVTVVVLTAAAHACNFPIPDSCGW